MTIEELSQLLVSAPETVTFDQVMQTISDNYTYTPSDFTNGSESDHVINKAGSNEGSCKIFSFAKLNNLDEKQTLACFGDYYRNDVLKHPENNDHANIRNFIKHGWDGIKFDALALTEK